MTPTDIYWLTPTDWHFLADTNGLTPTDWHLLTDINRLTFTDWHQLTDTYWLTPTDWHQLTLTFSVTTRLSESFAVSDHCQVGYSDCHYTTILCCCVLQITHNKYTTIYINADINIHAHMYIAFTCWATYPSSKNINNQNPTNKIKLHTPVR